MTKVYAEFDVDDDRLIDNDDETLSERFEEECGWVEQSGMILKNKLVVDENDDWHRYLRYLVDWAMKSQNLVTKTDSPLSYEEFLERSSEQWLGEYPLPGRCVL